MGIVHALIKNPRYKVIEIDNRYLMVDLTQNWYSYICPMFNWFIPMKYIEISSEEFSNINTFKNGNQNNKSMVLGGIGVTIGIFLKGFVDVVNISISTTLLLILFIIAMLASILLKINLSKKLKINIDNHHYFGRAILIPTVKNFLLVICIYIVNIMLVIGLFVGNIFYNKQNVLMYIIWILMFFIFMCLNMTAISDKKIHIKIKN
ncbi:DUF443 family protein [Staphylococcus aureus]|nr:DUF443 family protein [Staphylococcus aureus]QOY78511.1 DUF443 family protein [Staphylococcus aureus]